MSEQNQQQKEYTAEEILEFQKKTIAYYKSQKPVLTAQCEVEELKAQIAKAKYEAFEYTIKYISLQTEVSEKPEEYEKQSEENSFEK